MGNPLKNFEIFISKQLLDKDDFLIKNMRKTEYEIPYEELDSIPINKESIDAIKTDAINKAYNYVDNMEKDYTKFVLKKPYTPIDKELFSSKVTGVIFGQTVKDVNGEEDVFGELRMKMDKTFVDLPQSFMTSYSKKKVYLDKIIVTLENIFYRETFLPSDQEDSPTYYPIYVSNYTIDGVLVKQIPVTGCKLNKNTFKLKDKQAYSIPEAKRTVEQYIWDNLYLTPKKVENTIGEISKVIRNVNFLENNRFVHLNSDGRFSEERSDRWFRENTPKNAIIIFLDETNNITGHLIEFLNNSESRSQTGGRKFCSYKRKLKRKSSTRRRRRR